MTAGSARTASRRPAARVPFAPWWRPGELLAAATVLGGGFYLLVALYLRGFYAQFGLSPAEVGLGYGSVLSGASVGVAALLTVLLLLAGGYIIMSAAVPSPHPAGSLTRRWLVRAWGVVRRCADALGGAAARIPRPLWFHTRSDGPPASLKAAAGPAPGPLSAPTAAASGRSSAGGAPGSETCTAGGRGPGPVPGATAEADALPLVPAPVSVATLCVAVVTVVFVVVSGEWLFAVVGAVAWSFWLVPLLQLRRAAVAALPESDPALHSDSGEIVAAAAAGGDAAAVGVAMADGAGSSPSTPSISSGRSGPSAVGRRGRSRTLLRPLMARPPIGRGELVAAFALPGLVVALCTGLTMWEAGHSNAATVARGHHLPVLAQVMGVHANPVTVVAALPPAGTLVGCRVLRLGQVDGIVALYNPDRQRVLRAPAAGLLLESAGPDAGSCP